MPNVKTNWASGRSRDLFPGHGVNGKGDKTRVSDVEAYRQNYDSINWRRGNKAAEALPATGQELHPANSVQAEPTGQSESESEPSPMPAVSPRDHSGVGGPRKACV